MCLPNCSGSVVRGIRFDPGVLLGMKKDTDGGVDKWFLQAFDICFSRGGSFSRYSSETFFLGAAKPTGHNCV